MLKSQARFALMLSLEELFCSVDDFCHTFELQWKQLLSCGLKHRHRPWSLSLSGIMTLLFDGIVLELMVVDILSVRRDRAAISLQSDRRYKSKFL